MLGQALAEFIRSLELTDGLAQRDDYPASAADGAPFPSDTQYALGGRCVKRGWRPAQRCNVLRLVVGGQGSHQPALMPSIVRLSAEFFQEVTKHPRAA